MRRKSSAHLHIMKQEDIYLSFLGFIYLMSVSIMPAGIYVYHMHVWCLMWDFHLYAVNMFYYYLINKEAALVYNRAEYSQAGRDI